MINLTNLSFQYPSSTSSVLNGVNLQIPPGTLTLISGPSGSGKSTLLRCLNGLVPHFTGGQITGSVNVFGADPIASGPEAMAETVGFVFQEPEAQFIYDIVEDEIAFSLEHAGLSRDKISSRLDSVCTYLNLEAIRKKPIHQISGGEKQRVAVASALVNRPQVLILDEPTSQLDPSSADELLRYVVSLKQDLGLTVLIAEHRLERLLPYTDWMIHLDIEGNCAFGKPEDILKEMDQVPPIISIARKLNISPLPLSIEYFPKTKVPQSTHPSSELEIQPSQIHRHGLEVQDLSVDLEGKCVVDGISFSIHAGEILTLLGPNGAGKTTILRSIMGLIPYQGNIFLKSKPIEKDSLLEIIQHVGYLPQNPNDLLFAETVLDELIITLKNHGQDWKRDELILFLSNFSLSDHQNDYPRDLSVGERQRTALAAITVHNPDLVLLDEPTRGLDYTNKSKLAHLFRKWRSNGKGILVVTHDIEFAARLADRVILMESGKLLFSGAPTEAFHNYSDYTTQTAKLFPHTNWISPEEVPNPKK